MTEETVSRLGGLRLLLRGHFATQAAIMLPVVAIAGLTAWTMPSAPTSARGQPTGHIVGRPGQASPEAAPEPQQAALLATAQQTEPSEATAAAPGARAEPAALSGLKITSQSWRRSGLGSNALVTFTLRNDNDYAVKDIQITCSFSRQDGSHLTDRKRLIRGAVVDMKSRKTFARMHIGFVSIDANKAKCAPVAANRV